MHGIQENRKRTKTATERLSVFERSLSSQISSDREGGESEHEDRAKPSSSSAAAVVNWGTYLPFTKDILSTEELAEDLKAGGMVCCVSQSSDMGTICVGTNQGHVSKQY